MADTGAPWNIPYVEPSDLVRDYPAADEAQALAIAAGLSAAGNPGIGSNVVQTVTTDVFTTSSSSFVDVTNLSATITPSSATSKVLVLVYLSLSNTGDGGASNGRVLRGSTVLDVGDAAGSRTRASFAIYGASNEGRTGLYSAPAQSNVFLDSPGVASATTYKVQIRSGVGTATVNRSGVDSDGATFARTISGITLIEVAP